jgi:DNA polymerase-3 subunit epsilon
MMDRPSEAETLDFVVVDVETACSRVSSICQIGIVGFRAGREVFAYETLIDPRDEFSSFNTRIHGIRAEHVVGQPTFGEIHEIIAGHMTGRLTVAHSYFDKGALAAACRASNRVAIDTNWLDSVRVAKRAWPDLPSHRLNVLTGFLGIDHKHHDALSDARAAGMVIVKAIDYTGIGLEGWISAPKKQSGVAPKAADTGPLKGERVALLGEPRDGTLAHFVAKHGGRIVSSVGATTTMLVIGTDQPYGCWFSASAEHRKAQELLNEGKSIAIVTEAELRERLPTS